jgi:hypothetical protein
MITIPDWLPEYLERSELLRTLVDKLLAGQSDQSIAKYFEVPAEVIMLARKKWRLFRVDDGECPHCGEPGFKETCHSQRCISNWVLPDPKKKR